jgi:Xaa-Pro aminopeptidase
MDRAPRRRVLAERLSGLDAEALLVTRPANVRYLTGFSGSSGQLLLADGEAVFLTDGRYENQSRREVPDLRREISFGESSIPLLRMCQDLGFRRVAFEADGLTYRGYAALRDQGLDLVPATGEVERLRLVKDRDEIGLIEAAQAIADDSFDAIVSKLIEGVTERQTAFELDTFIRERTPDGVAFDTILAFGENAAEPHHHPTDRPLGRGDLVKMDFGSIVEGYHSDMTRTVAFGEPPPKMREVYEVVRRAQQAGVDAVTAGLPCFEADRITREVISEAGYGEAFKHPLGHGVGLEIHEAPWLRPGNDEPLPQGAVVTVEPGVYLEGEGGVRIEDMVEVTADGCRVIPRSPKDLIIV